MINVCLIKLNGWPDSFDERINIIAESVDNLYIIRGKQKEISSVFDKNNIHVIDLFPIRPIMIKSNFVFLYMFSYLLQTVYHLLYLSRERKINIIHAFDYPIDSIASIIPAKIYNLPVVLSLRGLELITGYQNEFPLILRLKRLLTKISIQHATHIIVNSAYQPQYISSVLQTSLPGVSVIPTGVNFSFFNPKNYSNAAAYKCLSKLTKIPVKTLRKKLIFVYIGRFAKIKGVDLFLRYCYKMKRNDVLFILVGSNQDIKNIDRMEQKNVKIINHIGINKIPLIYKIAKGTILLSEPDTEGAPRVLQESLAMGVPFIASNVTGIKDEFQDIQGAFLVERKSYDSFYKAFIEIIDNTYTIDKSIVYERFDIKQNYALICNIYTQIHHQKQLKTSLTL
jgi:glycosyltransferase involved in cell wall biosynthesis